MEPGLRYRTYCPISSEIIPCRGFQPECDPRPGKHSTIVVATDIYSQVTAQMHGAAAAKLDAAGKRMGGRAV